MCLSIGSIFFFKQKTAHDMRISDWSSDVGSSDLLADAVLAGSCALTAGTVPAATSAAMPQLQTLLIPVLLICPLLSGPKLMIFWITKETRNAEHEASPGRDYRQAACRRGRACAGGDAGGSVSADRGRRAQIGRASCRERG